MSSLTSSLTLGRSLGHGYFGEVHEGVDPLHGRVAVKLLKQFSGESDAEWQIRRHDLLSEGQRLKEARHTNVVQVLNLLEPTDTDQSLHLVLEYCEGGSLGAMYEAGPLTTQLVRRVATDSAMGLQAIHSRDMLHRDIKPANILLDGTGVAKISDFGLVTENLVYGYASAQGYVDHLAPEVLAGHGTSKLTDVWAFGMTLYRLLHGHAWYRGMGRPVSSVAAGGSASKLNWLPHITGEWRRFIRKLLHDDRASRYQNFSQVLNALGQIPVDGCWSCSYTPLATTWERIKNDKRQIIKLTAKSPRQQEWVATSQPADGSKKPRRLGSSDGMVNAATARKQLEIFFSNH